LLNETFAGIVGSFLTFHKAV